MGGGGKSSRGNSRACQIDPVNASREPVGRGGIHADQRAAAREVLDQGEHIAAPHDERRMAGQQPIQPFRDKRPDAVVPAVRIADAGHENFARRRGLRHERRIESLRKWVEQEMHGS